eukprot:8285521-Pyramimonas_sp.AAC.1
MIFFAATRGVWVLLEQPVNSMFFKHVCVDRALKMCKAVRIHTWLGGFGAATHKPLELHTTMPVTFHQSLRKSIRESKELLGASDKKLYKLNMRKVARSPSKKGWSAKGWVTKSDPSVIKQSQVYPVAFCKVVAAVVAGARD